MRVSWILTLVLMGCPQPTDATDSATDSTDEGSKPTDTPTTGDTGPTETGTDTGTPLPPGDLVDTCAEATTQTPLAPGRYEGNLASFGADIDPGGSSCLTRDGAPGGDMVGVVRVAPGDGLTLELVHGHGAVYLLEDCADAARCYDGAAEGPVSALRYVNEGTDPVDWFVVVDGTTEGGEPWALDLDLSPTTVNPLYDNCAQAAYAVSEMPGSMLVSMTGATDGANPGVGVCGLTEAQGGPDRLLPFEVLAGRLLTVDAPVVSYVMSDCSDPEGSCITSPLGGVTSWFNDGVFAERVFVALEAPADGRSDVFEVDLDMRAPNLVVTPDTCAEAEARAPLDLGPQAVSLQGLGHEGLNAQRCTLDAAPGVLDDAIFPVLVGAGAEATLEFPHPVVAYWMSDCSDRDACLGGGAVARDLAYHNDTENSVVVYAVVEGIDPVPGITEMSVRNRILTVPEWPDTCPDASGVTPVTKTGSVRVSLTSAADAFDASTSFCATPNRLDGGDRLVPVEVQAGDRVTASVTSGESAVALTLLTDCLDPDACDQTTTGGEAVDYYNGGVSPVTLYVVVDHPRAVAPGAVTIDVTFDTPDPLAAADTCAAADAQADVPAGSYVDRISDLTNDVELDGTEGCLLVPTPGPDALVPITVPAGQRLDVTVDGVLDQALVLTDCSDADTCEQGASNGDGPLSWPNDSGGPRSATLAIDGVVPLFGGDGEIEVDIAFTPSSALPGGDTCPAAMTATAPGSGSYHVNTAGLANDLEAGACLTRAAQGGDWIVPIELGADTLVDVTGWGADIELYFVDDCADDSTCGDPATPTDATGVVATRWYNDTGADAVRYLVVDRIAFDAEFVVELQEQAVVPTVPSDTCAAAAAVADLTTGTHLLGGTLVGLSDDVDPAAASGPSCTGAVAQGSDGLIPIELGGGQTVRATLWVTGADAALYLLGDCADPDSCLAGQYASGTETLHYTNPSVVPAQHFLAVDTLVGAGTYLLEVTID